MKTTLIKILLVFLIVTFVPLSSLCFADFSHTENLRFDVFEVSSGKILSLDEKEYLVGALFAQIDPNCDIEALKAQAIIAYTNALYEKETHKNSDYDFSVDISQQVLYIDSTTAKEKYKDSYNSLLSKIEEAVNSVKDEKVMFNSRLVLLPYFEVCCGITEDAYIVWGESAGYLTPVESNGDTLYPENKTVYNFTVEEIDSLMYEKYKIQTDDTETKLTVNNRTKSGTVTSCTVGDLTMTGQDFRSVLGLCSANFDIQCDGYNVTVVCYGKGHFVGMSQYGADFMARQGKTYREILTHYYTGIDIIE